MLRYARLFTHLVSFSLRKSMQFRLDFFFRIVMDVVYYATCVLFYQVLFGNVGSIGGWNFAQMCVFLGACFVVDAIQMTFVSNGMWEMRELVNKGTFDYFLVRPASAIFLCLLNDISLGSFLNLLLALGFLTYSIAVYPDPIVWWKIVLFAILLVNGFVVLTALRFLFMLPVFWLHRSAGIETVYYDMTHSMERPDRIFTGIGRFLFVYALPFGMAASFPTRILLEGGWLGLLVQVVAVTAVLLAISAFAWKRALKVYSSASS